MTQFMLAYHGGKQPASKEEGMAHMQKWQAWVQGLGDKVINPGTPLPQSKLLTANSVEDCNSPDAMKGFAVIQAESMDAAIEIAKTDPFLENGGTIRISQMMQMN